MATSTALPAPLGGWDTREALADMPEDHAVILDNFFPTTDKVTVRGGNSSHATGLPSRGETLFEYVPLDGEGEMFAAAGGDIYDVTSAGAVGAAVSTGHSNDRWQVGQISTAAGQFVRLVNGADTPLVYNGSTWGTTPAITGPTVTDLIWVNTHQRRMWIGEKDSLSAWYLPVNSIGGAATEFSLGGIAKLGGFIMGMGTWTRDAGDGLDDVAVFFTSEGEAIVYQGTDPASASTWTLVGVFRIGKPIGRRCFIQAGPDLVLITQDGFVPLAAILSVDRSQARLVSLSDQISKAVNDSVRDNKDTFGWEAQLYPKGIMMIFNIPQSTSTAHQYVFNTITGAPARFTGLNATCWSLLNDDVYWCDQSGNVNKFDDGFSDLGSNINADALQAFSYFGSKTRRKVFKMVEPIFESTGTPNPAIDFNVDFRIATPTGTAEELPTNSGKWGVGKWGIALWGTAGQIFKSWRGVRGVGRAGSIRMRINTSSTRPSWISTNYTYEPGGQL